MIRGNSTGFIMYASKVVFLILVAGCGTSNPVASVVMEVTSHRVASRTETPFVLSRLQNHPDITYRTYVLEYENAEAVFYASYVDVVFDPLTEAQFHLLRNYYGFGDSRVDYEADREFHLIDFMSPTMQVMNGKGFRFIETAENQLIVQNCWNVVYEVLRNTEQEREYYEVYQADPKSVLATFEDRSLFESVTLSSDAENGDLRDPNLRFGDVLLDVESDNLYHAALYVDKDLLFQKANPAEESLIGLQLVNDEFYRPDFLETIRFVRRSERGNLPEPAEIFRGYEINLNAGAGEDEDEFILSSMGLTTYHVNYEFLPSGRAEQTPESPLN